MKDNPANNIKDMMWCFLIDKGQKENIPALKEYVYDLIGMTTQKTAGQRKSKKYIDWDNLDMTLMSIAIEATALVISGKLDELEDKEKSEMTNMDRIKQMAAEEMAKIIACQKTECTGTDCVKCTEEWLKQEVEDER